jgi:pimeloyl-ACP methyl ester carboxylesterase
MRHPPLAPTWIDRPHHSQSIGDLPLESGETLRDCRLVWVEHGTRDAARANTVLVCCAIGSTHHRLDFLIGEGRALDPSRLHIVAVDALGNGLSASPSNSPGQPGRNFPRFTIRDMVRSQCLLLDALGIGNLHAVIGASMGGMQALQWAVSFPQRVGRVVAMTPMARTTRWSQLVNELARRALFEDDECRLPRGREDAMRLWVPLTQLIVPVHSRCRAGVPQSSGPPRLDRVAAGVVRYPRPRCLRLAVSVACLRRARPWDDAGLRRRYGRGTAVDPCANAGAGPTSGSLQSGTIGTGYRRQGATRASWRFRRRAATGPPAVSMPEMLLS